MYGDATKQNYFIIYVTVKEKLLELSIINIRFTLSGYSKFPRLFCQKSEVALKFMVI